MSKESKLARAGIEFLKIQVLTCIDQIKAGNVWWENDQKSAATNGPGRKKPLVYGVYGHPKMYILAMVIPMDTLC